MNPVLLNFPSEFYTERLLIRMPKPGDGKAVYEAIQASKADLKPWLPFAQQDQTEQETEANMRRALARFWTREDLRLLVFLKDSGRFVGSSGLHRPNWDIPKFEIGYWIDSRLSGHGYMTEAVQGITAFAFRELHARRVEIRCDSLNSRSRAIPERLGFQLEGTLRNEDMAADGSGLRDTCIYAKVSDPS